MSQQLSTVSISQLTDLVERSWAVNNSNFVERGNATRLVIEDDLAAHTGDTKRYTEIDVEEFALNMDEGDNASQARVQYGYEKDMVMRRFAREIVITWKMRRTNKKPEVVAQLTSLNHFCPNRMELDITHRVTFAASTAYTDMDGISQDVTTGDGLALLSSVHTLRGSSTTFSNVITGNPQFSKGGLEIAEGQANTQILSHFGERRVMNFNAIWSGDDPTTCNDIKQYLRSASDPDQNNPSVVNVYQDKYTHIKLPRLATTATGVYDSTKAKYWGLAAVGQGIMGWQAYVGIWERPNLKTPVMGGNGDDFSNDNWKYGTRGSWGICIPSPRGFLMSKGDGS